MKVLINLSVLSRNYRGMGGFTKQILNELIVNKTYEFIFVSANELDKEISAIIRDSNCLYIQINSPLPFFEQILIPYLIYKYKPDLCWFPSNTFPIIKINKTKYIVTIHDLIFLYKSTQKLSLYQFIGKVYRKYNILMGINKIDFLTSVSNTSLEEMVNKFNFPKNRTLVLYNSFAPIVNEDNVILKKLNLNSEYLYAIVGTAPHKNLDFLIESFQNFNLIYPEYKLVLSGASKSQHNGKNSNIIFTSFITEEEKTSLIKDAKIFIFPSLFEGFGIPLIEGLYHNSNVLVSNIDIFKEIGQDYVSYFDPYDKNFLISYFRKDKKEINHDEAKQYILETFNAKKTTQKLESIFNEFE